MSQKQLETLGAKLEHPSLAHYGALALRVRFLSGFDKDALGLMRTLLFEEMGKRGMAHKKFPLHQTLLLAPDILTSQGFQRSKEKDAVPMWRDGAAGARLQADMVRAAASRYFDFKGEKSEKPLFAAAAHWTALGRLIEPIKAAFLNRFGASQQQWPEPVQARLREIWRGDYDAELVRLSAAVPVALEVQAMASRVAQELPCISRLLATIAEIELVGVAAMHGSEQESTKTSEAEIVALPQFGSQHYSTLWSKPCA